MQEIYVETEIEELKRYPITDMVGDRTYNIPKGTWSDDTSMTLATIDSILNTKIRYGKQIFKMV